MHPFSIKMNSSEAAFGAAPDGVLAERDAGHVSRRESSQICLAEHRFAPDMRQLLLK
jgi:hypothetical protein